MRHITSTRKPRLRAVGTAREGVRHAAILNRGDSRRILEVWTFLEWDALDPAHRPDEVAILPGIGFVATLTPNGEAEVQDVADVQQQAMDQRELVKGSF